MPELRTFYINLDRDIERRDHMERCLDIHGLKYERISAIDGKNTDLSSYYNEQSAVQKNNSPLTQAEVGCAASHREIYRRIVQEKIPYSLIFEDDIEVTSNFRQIVTNIISKNEKTRQWEYLTFDYAESGTIFLKRWLYSVKLNYTKNIQGRPWITRLQYIIFSMVKFFFVVPTTYFESLRNRYYKSRGKGLVTIFFRPLYFAGCYLVTLDGAEKLLSLSEPYIVYPADRLPNQARLSAKLRFRAYVPIVAKQRRREFGSHIGEGVDFNNYQETSL